MNEELARLKAELKDVESSDLEYLPQYGYSSKEEIIELIKEDIKELEDELENIQFDYTDDELEYERTRLCISQGISRYC